MKIGLIFLTVILGLLVIIETSLRLIFGLGNPPLYIGDEKIGYLLAPSQQVRRFGNKIVINQYSMRSEFFQKKRPENVFRILLLGDSIINGGWWTDQDETISALVSYQLNSRQTTEVLNASANSWGPRNELAYLQKFGIFEAQVIVLVINTDDLFAMAPTSAPVGVDRNYPAQKPPLALGEIINHILPAKPMPVFKEGGDRVGFNLTAIEQIQAIANQENSQFILVMTPLLRELPELGSRDYELKARKRLKEFTHQKNIVYIDFLPIFQKQVNPEKLYRDHIHLSPQGNELVSETISRLLAPSQAIGVRVNPNSDR